MRIPAPRRGGSGATKSRIEEQIFAFIPKPELKTGETDRGANGGAGR